MKNKKDRMHPKNSGMDRRVFLTTAGTALAASLMPFESFSQQPSPAPEPDSLNIKSNVHIALCQPKTRWSMPGLYPGIVAEVHRPGSMNGMQPVFGAAKLMLAAGLKSLTGEKDPRDAWRRFVTPGERIGIKFNPVGHKVCGVTWDVIGAVVEGLESAGIPRKDMLVWHRFDDEHARTYKSEAVHPGVEAYLLNWFIVKNGKNTPGGFERWDESVYYEADVSLPDEKNILEEMFHGGNKSFFPRILTNGGSAGGVDKVINVPAFKHHGRSFITMALKNLAFGSTTNCPRGHLFIERFISEVCAFPPLRDKVVLNIMDGLRGQYDRGPAPAPQFVWPLERLYVGTDPVAMDTIGFDVLLAKQVETGRLAADKADEVRKKHYGLAVAENLGLGVHKGRPIEKRLVTLG